MTSELRYRAFISYSHRDKPWADWLHRALESYSVPKALVGTQGRVGPIPRRLFPIYRDRDETPAISDLQDYIKKALADSAALIVICSPSSRQSAWVSEEILTFKRLGREDRIFAIIVEGEPHDSDITGDASPSECFPKALLYRIGPDGELTNQRLEPAAADARSHADGKENAKLKLIAGLLGTDFGNLKQRDLEAARRRTRIYGAIAVAMAGLAVVATVAGILAYQNALRAEKATKAAVTQARTAERTSDFMVDLFSIADPEKNRGQTITAREMLDRGVIKLRSGLSGEDVVRSNLLRAMGQAYSGLGLYPKADTLLQAAASAAQRGGSPDAHLKALLALASNTYIDGHYAKAVELYKRALNEAQHGPAANEEAVASAYLGLGDSVSELNQARDAEAYYRKALAIDLRLHGAGGAATADAYNALGTQLFLESKLAEAEPLFRRALAIRVSLYGYRHADVAASLSNLGTLEYDAGRYSEAEATWTKAYPIYQAVYGKEHPEVATILNNIGRVQLVRGEIVSAKESLTGTLALDRKFRDPDDDDLILPLNSLAMIAIAQGDYPNAAILLSEALRIARLRHHWMLNQVLGNLADLNERTGDKASARMNLDLAQAELKTQYGALLAGKERWRAAVLDLVEAALMRDAGQLEPAQRSLLVSLAVLQERFGPQGLFTHRAEELLFEIARSRRDLAGQKKYRTLLAANPLR